MSKPNHPFIMSVLSVHSEMMTGLHGNKYFSDIYHQYAPFTDYNIVATFFNSRNTLICESCCFLDLGHFFNAILFFPVDQYFNLGWNIYKWWSFKLTGKVCLVAVIIEWSVRLLTFARERQHGPGAALSALRGLGGAAVGTWRPGGPGPDHAVGRAGHLAGCFRRWGFALAVVRGDVLPCQWSRPRGLMLNIMTTESQMHPEEVKHIRAERHTKIRLD